MIPEAEGEFWREYDVEDTIRVVVPITIEAGRLRVKQTKSHGRTFYVNFANGVFLTSAVLDRLLRDGRLTPHVHPHPSKKRHYPTPRPARTA